MTLPDGQYSIKAFGPLSKEKPFRVNMEYDPSTDNVQLMEVRSKQYIIIPMKTFELMDPRLHITDRIGE